MVKFEFYSTLHEKCIEQTIENSYGKWCELYISFHFTYECSLTTRILLLLTEFLFLFGIILLFFRCCCCFNYMRYLCPFGIYPFWRGFLFFTVKSIAAAIAHSHPIAIDDKILLKAIPGYKTINLHCSVRQQIDIHKTVYVLCMWI